MLIFQKNFHVFKVVYLDKSSHTQFTRYMCLRKVGLRDLEIFNWRTFPVGFYITFYARFVFLSGMENAHWITSFSIGTECFCCCVDIHDWTLFYIKLRIANEDLIISLLRGKSCKLRTYWCKFDVMIIIYIIWCIFSLCVMYLSVSH